MPLIKSANKEAVAENIRELRKSGYGEKQAVAIAMDVQRKARGGKKKAKKPVDPDAASEKD